MDMQRIDAAGAVPMLCDLFRVHTGSQDHLGTKARNATEEEVRAYFDWLRRRAGLPDLGTMSLEGMNYGFRGRDNPRCCGATFGKARQHPTLRDPGSMIYEEGAYSIPMPGFTRHPATVTMETLDDAGEVVATSTLPVEPKKGGVVWSRNAVRAAHGPITKPTRKRKAGPSAKMAAPEPAERVEAVEAIADALSGCEAGENAAIEAPADPVAALIARLDALEATVAALSVESGATPTGVDSANPGENIQMLCKPKRTSAHERAIRRAWEMRRERIERADLDRRALLKVNADNRLLLEQLHRAEAVRDEMVRRGDAMRDERDRLQELLRVSETKRRKNALLARQRTREMVAAVNQLLGERDALRADLDTARRTPTYFDADSGIEKFDLVGQQAHFAKLATERAERTEHALAAMSARCARAEASRDAVADTLEKMGNYILDSRNSFG